MSSPKRGIVNSGISLFLVLLIIMCLVSFASLSLTSAVADRRLSDKYARQVENYYAARNLAQDYLRDLDLGKENAPAGNGTLTRSFPAGETMQLTVTYAPPGARTNDEASSGDTDTASSGWRIVGERFESTVDYDYDESLHVMKSPGY